MTAAQFRRLALSFPGTIESAHMNHPDFRVAGKIFATIAYPNKKFAMVKLTPIQQDDFVHSHPAVFNPCNGAWGRKGCTNVCLRTATEASVRQALMAAWRNIAPKRIAQL